MSSLASSPFEYRHVVFPCREQGDGHPINFGLRPAEVAPSRATPNDLTFDEQDCVQWLFGKAGLHVGDYRLETLKRRVSACVRALHVESARDIRSAIDRQPHLLHTAVSALLIGVSSFFRDPSVFASLRDAVLPDLVAQNAAPRIWSAACSDGAELYSIAMLLAELGGSKKCAMLGTDCRADAIARARMGSYAPDGIIGLPNELLSRYFVSDGRVWQIHPSLRAATQWRTGNILQSMEPGSWDLILCRNMAIYLQPAAAGTLWAQLLRSLRPGGILVLGKAERPQGATGLKPVAPCIYRSDRS